MEDTSAVARVFDACQSSRCDGTMYSSVTEIPDVSYLDDTNAQRAKRERA